jgi:acyl-CoA thioesterase I
MTNSTSESETRAFPGIADKETYLIDVIREMLKPWPDNRAVNIVVHGHSVPAGYFATPVVNSLEAYPHLLFTGLKQRFAYAVINVIVTAIGGENSEQGAARFESEVLCHRPDVVTIDYALNDRVLGLQNAEIAWRKMIEACLSRGARVILLTPTHDVLTLRRGEPMWAEELPKHTAQVRRLAAEYGAGLADSDAAFNRYVANGGELIDLLSHINHPNRLGHKLVARELLRWFPAQ